MGLEADPAVVRRTEDRVGAEETDEGDSHVFEPKFSNNCWIAARKCEIRGCGARLQ